MVKSIVKIKRVYGKPKKEDDFRILADRLWPRGLSKEKAKVNLWLKDIAPSYKLRKWFSHDLAKWQEFVKKYKSELRKNKTIQELKNIIQKHKVVTLLFGSSDIKHNNAVALKRILKL